MNRKHSVIASLFAVSLVIGGALSTGAQSTPGPASTCNVAPRSFDELALLAATPVPSTTPQGLSPIGEPIDANQIAQIHTTVQRFIDCSNSGEPLRVFALYTDRYLQQLLSIERPLIDRARYDSLATPIPAKPGEGAVLVSIERELRHLDGRLGAEVTITYPSIPMPKTFVFTFVVSGDRMLIDDILGELTFALP
ncbi:MAG: hypothetical protein ACRDHN_21690 [Thermomicrobiales bacterium]